MASNIAFKNASSAYLARELEAILEDDIKKALMFRKRSWVKKETPSRALEKKAVPLIIGIIRTLDPDASENIRNMDREMIWRAYWKRRQRHTGPTNLSIFEFLRELEKKPSLAHL